jgi:hypothetical protein
MGENTPFLTGGDQTALLPYIENVSHKYVLAGVTQSMTPWISVTGLQLLFVTKAYKSDIQSPQRVSKREITDKL